MCSRAAQVGSPRSCCGEAAQALADRLCATLTAQARTITAVMPGDAALAPRNRIRLAGDVGDWAGAYRIIELRRRFDMRRGYQQTITAQQDR